MEDLAGQAAGAAGALAEELGQGVGQGQGLAGRLAQVPECAWLGVRRTPSLLSVHVGEIG